MNLLPLISEAIERAASQGALIPLEISGETITDAGVDFRVEWLSTLALKDADKLPRVGDKAKPDFNPFLPYERALYIADISPERIAILNKFPSRRGHFLIISESFVEQESPLNVGDALAAAIALQNVDGLFFYNSGSMAGASQRHRHLQIIPDTRCPLEAILPLEGFEGPPSPAPIPFRNLFRRWSLLAHSAERAAHLIAQSLASGYERFGLLRDEGATAPHNILMTQSWFLMVPRITETSQGISQSALSLAGIIGLRSANQIEAVRARGPMQMQIDVAGRA